MCSVLISLRNASDELPKDIAMRPPKKARRKEPTHFSPPELTGDAGGDFESSVGAFAIAQLLTGATDFGGDLGLTKQIQFQTKDIGSGLDDLALTYTSPTSELRTLSISVKRNSQVTRNGFSLEFVRLAWREYLSDRFDRDRDCLLLAVGTLARGVSDAWEDLRREALAGIGDEARLVVRWRQSSKMKQALFQSLECPSDLCADSAANPEHSVHLIRCIRLKYFDFRSDSSSDTARAHELCRQALENGDTNEAIKLFERLKSLVAAKRPTGGAVDLPNLIRELRDFRLRNHPVYDADWQKLRQLTENNLLPVRTDVGGLASMVREDCCAHVEQQIRQSNFLALVGDSGVGKSAVLKRVAPSLGRVIWFAAEDFDDHVFGSLESRLALQHDLPSILMSTTDSVSILVIDSAERLSMRSLDRAATLIQRVADHPNSPWRIVVTSQPDRWEDVASSFAVRGLARRMWNQTLIDFPDLASVSDIINAIPRLQTAFARSELRELMRNLKILDWVVTCAQPTSTIDAQNWIGVSDIVEWLWQHWTAGQNRFARAGLLKKIATLEAESFASGVPLSRLSHEELRTLGELAESRLIREFENRVFLDHDLLGDWARVQVLIEEQPQVTDTFRQWTKQPRWHRAIRLFAQRLLEHPALSNGWERHLVGSAQVDTDSGLVRDLFLEAVCRAANAQSLLEQLWPQLSSTSNGLLQRMLRRFYHVATFADPRMLALANREDDTLWFAALCRLPRVNLWVPMITFLYSHSNEVISLAPTEVSRLCKLWLGSLPAESAPGRAFPLRREVAKLAILLGREIQALKAEGAYFEGDIDEKAFEVALHAAIEYPDDVSAFALEMCCRREESPEIGTRRAAYRQRMAELYKERERTASDELRQLRASRPVIPLGPLRKPWPDGPLHRVDEAFQTACLNSTALQPLMHIRPEVAREVLLAVCIEEPKHEDPYRFADSLHDTFGLEAFLKWFKPAYFRGPFLNFLRISPEHGLTAILQLVNFATQRWQEHSERYRDRHPLDDSPTTDESAGTRVETSLGWPGNASVYGWHRDRVVDGNILASSLMALEKWLYDEVEAERPIDKWVGIIFSSGQSVALAGVLISVGKKYPHLLTTCIRPLLVDWQYYYWDQQLVMEDAKLTGIGFAMWTREGEQVFNLARDWAALPHRKQLLMSHAALQMLSKPEMAEFFVSVRAEWSSKVTDSDNALKFLIARFDPSNYKTHSLEDGRIVRQLEWPDELEKDSRTTTQETDATGALFYFPIRCRKLLDGEESLDADGLNSFWDLLQSLDNKLKEANCDDDGYRQANAVAGGIAVLTVQHYDWLTAEPSREEWCAHQIETIIEHPPARREYDVRESITNYSWENFVGEIAIASFARDRSLLNLRAHVASAIMGFHYQTTRLAMQVAFRLRDMIGDDFGRMLNLAAMYAGLSYAARYRTDYNAMDDQRWGGLLQRCWNRMLDSFVDRKIPSAIIAWEPISRHAYDAAERHWRRLTKGDPFYGEADDETESTSAGNRKQIKRRHAGLDIQFLPAAFGWIPSLNLARSEDERATWIDLHRKLLSVTLTNLEGADTDDDRKIDGTPYPFDRWVFQRIAVLIAHMRDDEHPEHLWRPIVDLGPKAHYWVTMFFNCWLLNGRNASCSPPEFVRRWKSIIEYSIDAPAWQSRRFHYRVEDLHEALLGFDFGWQDIDDEKYANAIENLKSTLQSWSNKWLSAPRLATGFARFVATPSGKRLLVPAICWLAAAHMEVPHRRDDESHLNDALVTLLYKAWTTSRYDLETNTEFRDAYVALLANLVERHSSGAFELHDHVIRSLSRAG